MLKLYDKDLEHHWVGEEPDPENSFGFIYSIVNILNGIVYVGRKQYKGRRKRKDGTYYEVYNKWKFYTGSSKYVNEDIEKVGKAYFIFIIIKNISDEETLNSEEVNILTELNVLKSQNIFYNKNIGGVYFSVPFKADKKVDKRPNYIGENNPNYGKSHSKEAKILIGKSSKERGISEETRLKMAKSAQENKKIYFFTKNNGETFMGTVDEFCLRYSDVKKHGIKDLIRGKIRDKTCNSGYSKVHSRYGWVKAEYICKVKELNEEND